MPWYMVCRKDDGTPISLGTVLGTLDEYVQAVGVGETMPDLSVVQWDKAKKAFVPIIPEAEDPVKTAARTFLDINPDALNATQAIREIVKAVKWLVKQGLQRG